MQIRGRDHLHPLPPSERHRLPVGRLISIQPDPSVFQQVGCRQGCSVQHCLGQDAGVKAVGRDKVLRQACQKAIQGSSVAGVGLVKATRRPMADKSTATSCAVPAFRSGPTLVQNAKDQVGGACANGPQGSVHIWTLPVCLPEAPISCAGTAPHPKGCKGGILLKPLIFLAPSGHAFLASVRRIIGRFQANLEICEPWGCARRRE